MRIKYPIWFLASNKDLNPGCESCIDWVLAVLGAPTDFQSIETQSMVSLTILEHLESDILRFYHPKTTNFAKSDLNA